MMRITRLMSASTFVLLLVAIALAACGVRHDEEGKAARFRSLEQGTAPQIRGQADGETAVRDRQRSDLAAQELVKLERVDAAYVLLYDGDAYVALQLKDIRTRVPLEIQAEVEKRVRDVVPEVDHIYITTNLTFVSWIYSYLYDIHPGLSDDDLKLQLQRLRQDSFTTKHPGVKEAPDNR
mgnify:FL=1|jgi:YhcN/YlaJ family sporulation lipoprotein